MLPPPWYHEGLRFQCTECGDCCTGDPGFVWVTNREIRALAEALGLDVAEFEAKYVRRVGSRKSLVERPSGDCILFDGKKRKCTVYEHRPRQCRTWPFWQSNVESPAAWRETCKSCPGSGKGRLYTIEEIQRQVGVIEI